MMATQVAQAYVQVVPSLKGIRNALTQGLGGEVSKAGDTAGKTLGEHLTGGLSGALKGVGGVVGKAMGAVAHAGKAGAVAIGGMATAVTGLAATGGVTRALQIEGAQAKLTGLGHSTEEVAGIMSDAMASVKGTAYGLGDAASVAATMVASGIKPGQQLSSVLKTIGDTATISGRSFQDVGAIFSSVAARGKLQGDDMLQLTSAGVPVLQALSKQLGKSTEDVSDMVSHGEIDFQTFADAMQASLGGSALASGQTFSGALDNVKAALSRLGAAAATPALAALKTVFNAAIPAVDGLTASLQPVIDQLGGAFTAAGQKAADSLQGIGDKIKAVIQLLSTGDFTGEIGAALNVEEDSPLVTVLLAVRDAAESVGYALGNAKDWLDQFLAEFTYMAGPNAFNSTVDGMYTALITLSQGLSGIIPDAQNAGRIAEGVFFDIRMAVASLMPAISSAIDWLSRFFQKVNEAGIVGALGSALVTVAKAFGDFAQAVMAAIPPDAFADAVNRIITPLQWIADHQGVVTAALYAIAGGLAFKGVSSSIGTVVGVLGKLPGVLQGVATAAGGVATTAGNISAVFQLIKEGNGIGASLSALGSGLGIVKNGLSALTSIGGAVTGVLGAIGSAFSALGAIIAANPLGALLTVIAAVVAGLTLFFTKTETGRQVWSNIAAFFTNVWNGILNVFRTVFGAIGSFFTNVWNGLLGFVGGVVNAIAGFITGVFNAVASWWQGVWNTVSSVFTTVWNAILGFIVPILTKLGEFFFDVGIVIAAVFVTLWRGVQTVFVTVWNAILAFVTPIVTAISDFITGVFNAVASWWSGVWQGISDFFTSIWNGICGFVTTIVTTVSDTITTVFNAVASWWSGVWQGISDFFTNVWNGICGFVGGVVDAVSSAIHSVIDPIVDWWNGVWQGISDTFSRIWDGLSTAAENAVTTVVDKVKGIKDKILDCFKNAGEWLKDVGGHILEGLWNGISDKFNWLKDKIGEICGNVVDWAKQVLGIGSPSKVMRDEVGKWIPAGMALGIRDGRTGVRLATEDMMDTVSGVPAPAFGVTWSAVGGGTAGLQPAAASYGRTAGTTVNLTAPIIRSDEDLYVAAPILARTLAREVI
ncbi:tape measure protein [Pseudoscardovia radai]|uniref:tape measure protein n=1 Tax=Pseudoscardovia radai TaxID=987066 RepID=UPI0039943AFE